MSDELELAVELSAQVRNLKAEVERVNQGWVNRMATALDKLCVAESRLSTAEGLLKRWCDDLPGDLGVSGTIWLATDTFLKEEL